MTAELLNLELGVRLRVFPTNNRVVGLAFAPDGSGLQSLKSSPLLLATDFQNISGKLPAMMQ